MGSNDALTLDVEDSGLLGAKGGISIAACRSQHATKGDQKGYVAG